MAAVLVPLLLIGVLEGLLRLAGYGYSTRFFKPSTVNGVDYLVPNERFTHRFFPPAVARPVLPFRMLAKKPEGTYRIFVFGASAALGDPDPCYGVTPLLQELLDTRHPNIDFEVFCVAMTAVNSHVVLPVARECARLEGDLWVVYLGNNEMVGPFGASTVFGRQAAPMGFVRASLFVKSTRLGQLMMRLLGGLGTSAAAPDRWTGIDMFKDNQLRHDDPSKDAVYINFRRNLKAIAAVGQRAGVPVLLTTVGSNLRDCSPFASLHQVGLDSRTLDQWAEAFDEALALEDRQEFEAALARYRTAEAIDPYFAELQYRMGICLMELGEQASALEALQRARDYDALSVRADSRINGIIQSVATETAGNAKLVDAAVFMAQETPPGRDWFHEHVHLTPEGNYRLAKLIAQHIDPLLPPTVSGTDNQEWAEMPDCLDARALTSWDRRRIYHEIYQRIAASPFDSQSSNEANKTFIAEQVEAIKSQTTSETPTINRELYATALARRPEDASLTANLAQFLDGHGRESEALEYAYQFRDLLPDIAWTHYYLGAQLANNGRYEEAEASLEQALEILGEFTHAENALKEIRVKRMLNSPVTPAY
jgi:tetratricopeptide (TPR) repeat protein